MENASAIKFYAQGWKDLFGNMRVFMKLNLPIVLIGVISMIGVMASMLPVIFDAANSKNMSEEDEFQLMVSLLSRIGLVFVGQILVSVLMLTAIVAWIRKIALDEEPWYGFSSVFRAPVWLAFVVAIVLYFIIYLATLVMFIPMGIFGAISPELAGFGFVLLTVVMFLFLYPFIVRLSMAIYGQAVGNEFWFKRALEGTKGGHWVAWRLVMLSLINGFISYLVILMFILLMFWPFIAQMSAISGASDAQVLAMLATLFSPARLIFMGLLSIIMALVLMAVFFQQVAAFAHYYLHYFGGAQDIEQTFG